MCVCLAAMEEDVIGMTQLLDGGHRKFYELPNKAHHLPPETEDRPTTDGLFSYIEDNIIGKDKVFSGPFGLRKGKSWIVDIIFMMSFLTILFCCASDSRL